MRDLLYGLLEMFLGGNEPSEVIVYEEHRRGSSTMCFGYIERTILKAFTGVRRAKKATDFEAKRLLTVRFGWEGIYRVKVEALVESIDGKKYIVYFELASTPHQQDTWSVHGNNGAFFKYAPENQTITPQAAEVPYVDIYPLPGEFKIPNLDEHRDQA